MTEQNRDKLIEKVKKLLALSQSPNEHEASAAAEKAQALLAEYNIALSEVETTSDKEDDMVMEGGVTTSSYPWQRTLSAAVAQMYLCKSFYMTYRGKGKDEHFFVGAKHNVDVAKMMFVYLVETIDRLAKEGARSVPDKERSPYRTTFRVAASQRVQNRIYVRIQEAKSGQMKASSGGSNLPALASLYDSWRQRNDEFLKQQLGQELRTKTSKMSILHGKGLADGRAAGERIGLDQQVGGGAKRAALR